MDLERTLKERSIPTQRRMNVMGGPKGHSHAPHNPHNHNPHSHNPHSHNPHSHHSHNPHSHNPHSHNPHSHTPHSHTPHSPTPAPTLSPTANPTRSPTATPTSAPTTRSPTPAPARRVSWNYVRPKSQWSQMLTANATEMPLVHCPLGSSVIFEWDGMPGMSDVHDVWQLYSEQAYTQCEFS